MINTTIKTVYLPFFQDDPSQDVYYAYNNIIINGVGTQGFEHHQSYILENLVPDSMYEAQIQAKNHFGWSAISEKFQFYTRAYGEFIFLEFWEEATHKTVVVVV